MSADNMICVAYIGNFWWVWMDFASNDVLLPKQDDVCFGTEEEALIYAFKWFERESVVEYGVRLLTTEDEPIDSGLYCHFVIKGNLPRKSNSRRVVHRGKGGPIIVIKSETALEYANSFAEQLPDEAKGNWGSLKEPLFLKVHVYYSSRRPDLSIELLKDLLEDNKVVKNDRYIREQHSKAFMDKNDPRVEVWLYKLIER